MSYMDIKNLQSKALEIHIQCTMVYSISENIVAVKVI